MKTKDSVFNRLVIISDYMDTDGTIVDEEYVMPEGSTADEAIAYAKGHIITPATRLCMIAEMGCYWDAGEELALHHWILDEWQRDEGLTDEDRHYIENSYQIFDSYNCIWREQYCA